MNGKEVDQKKLGVTVKYKVTVQRRKGNVNLMKGSLEPEIQLWTGCDAR